MTIVGDCNELVQKVIYAISERSNSGRDDYKSLNWSRIGFLSFLITRYTFAFVDQVLRGKSSDD